MKLKAGDLVACRDEHYFQQLGVQKNLGIVLENKKSSYKVMFDEFQKGYWLSDDLLAKKKTATSKLVEEVSAIVRQLNALSFELERAKTSKTVLLEMILEKISYEEMAALQQKMGQRYRKLVCLPHLMAEIKLELEFSLTK